ncbi:MAG TPA: hypothetical protein VKT75_01710, partial [Acidobacteriaceae bacterium]|nr:hypothetical protein [Acidobacteriaceae bacterium]
SQQFSAAVNGSCNQLVTWTNPSGVGTLSASGVYTAPASLSGAQTITAVATSQTTPAVSSTASITLSPVLTVTVAPAAPSPYVAATTQSFTVTVQNAGAFVNRIWPTLIFRFGPPASPTILLGSHFFLFSVAPAGAKPSAAAVAARLGEA